MSGITKQSERPGPTRPARTEAARTRSPLWKRLAPVAVFFAIAVAVIGWHMSNYHYLSPIDENAHFDYIRILPEVPGGDDRLSQDALRMTACRRYAPDIGDQGLIEWAWPPCRSKTFDPGVFPGGGPSTAGSTAPLYYVVTAALTRPIAYVVDIPLLLLARAAGVFWLTGLMTVTYLVGRRLRVSKLAAGSAAVLLCTSSDAVTSASTLGPDTATALTGGLVLLAALAYDGGRRSALWLLAAVAVAAVTKLTAFTAVGAAMVVLLVRVVQVHRRGDRRGAAATLGTVALMGLVFAALSAAWFYRPGQEAGATGTPSTVPPLELVPWGDIKAPLFFNFLPPNIDNFNAGFLNGLVGARLDLVMAGLVTFSVLVAVLALRRNWQVGALGWGVAIAAVTGPVVLTLLYAFAYHAYMPLPARYGYGLMAGFGALTAWTCRGTVAARALAVLAVVSVLNVFV